MTQYVTWLGEDTEDLPGPSFNVWNGIKFPKGQPVAVTDPHMLKKARVNHFYKVTSGDDQPAREPKRHEVKAQIEIQTETKGPQEQAEQQGQPKDYPPVEQPPKKRKVKKPKTEKPKAEAGPAVSDEP